MIQGCLVRRLARPGLEIVGAVDDLGPVFASARLTIAPLRYGAGLKGKVIESLAAGVPCIGTRIAYEGIELPTAFSACLADTAEAVAAAVVRLYHDDVTRPALAEAGRRHRGRLQRGDDRCAAAPSHLAGPRTLG